MFRSFDIVLLVRMHFGSSLKPRLNGSKKKLFAEIRESLKAAVKHCNSSERVILKSASQFFITIPLTAKS
jgi:hypothetical protein